MRGTPDDPFDLQRFLDAQSGDYPTALAELRRGRKRSHWIWYVLPQLRGLGMSGNSQYYGIGSLDEARAYLAHPVLGPRLCECVEAIERHKGTDIAAILGGLDAMKYRSCLTLFRAAAGAQSPFARGLDEFFGGEEDPKTIALLGQNSR